MTTNTHPLILIVEDNDLNLKLFRDILEAHGYRTLTSQDGMEVLPLARQHRPNLIIMDIQLPEVSGLDVIQWLKIDPELKKIPVIAITAFAMRGDEDKIRASGCDDYLSKPIAVNTFTTAIRNLLPPLG